MSFPRLPLLTLITAMAVVGLSACATDVPAAKSHTPVTLAPLFADHAVLQRGKPVPIWGWAGPGDTVTVSFQGQTVHATADAAGQWSATLASLPAIAKGSDLVVSGSDTVTLHDVVVGEVWLCSGQSNMEFQVSDRWSKVLNADNEVAAANYPLIRQLLIERTVAAAPASNVKTNGWKAATPENVGEFTAVGYFFARDIHHALGVPVGIIDSPWGGTPVESWMSAEARKATSLDATINTRWQEELAKWPPERVAAFPALMKAWNEAQDKAVATHTQNPLRWPDQPATADSPYVPGGLYNGMIHPLVPGAIRGVLWYQGESNAGHPGEYAELFKAMITNWRSAFGQGDVPFYFVGLANFGDVNERANRGWAGIREAQEQALALPNTGMALAVDIGEAANIHPTNKQEVGRRLALIARAQVYGLTPEYIGPTFESAAREGSSMRVHFTHAGNELSVRGDAVDSLELAGADKVFHPASGVINVDTLLVSSPDVPEPVAVRYAWTNSPKANLYGDTGLPAVPFRSDSW